MRDPQQAELDQALYELVFESPPPEWLEDMIDHYQRFGAYRPEDIQRLFGDITKGVTVDESLEDFLEAALKQRKP